MEKEKLKNENDYFSSLTTLHLEIAMVIFWCRFPRMVWLTPAHTPHVDSTGLECTMHTLRKPALSFQKHMQNAVLGLWVASSLEVAAAPSLRWWAMMTSSCSWEI